MSLVNKTRKKVVMQEVMLARRYWQRTMGLMFSKPLRFALVFYMHKEGKASSAIHSFFVFYPIDAVFLDSRKKVVDIAAIKPFTPYYAPRKAAKYIVELPEGKGKEFRIGDKVEWK